MAIKQNKASSFVNFYAPTQSGGKKKIGFLMLCDDDPVHQAVHNAILKDGLDVVLSKLIVEHNIPGTNSDDDSIAL